MSQKSPLADKQRFASAAAQANSVREFLSLMGLKAGGGTWYLAKSWSEKHGIPIPKQDRNITGLKMASLQKKIPDELVFVENSSYPRTHLRKRLLSTGVPYQCSIEDCPNPEPTWRGKPLVLHLDHINGIPNDNRKDNLRFLCPNCHTQTETYAGKARKLNQKAPSERKTKIDWPPKDTLLEMVENFGYRGTGARLGVSDNAVRKRIKKLLSSNP